MLFIKHILVIFLITYTKQDCNFLDTKFSCRDTQLDDIIYEFNSKKPEDAEVLSIEITNCSYTTVDNFFQSLDNAPKEKLNEIRITNSKVKEVTENSFEAYPALKVLDLSSNQIENMSFLKSLPESIVEINLSNNSFTGIEDVFTNLKNLRYIDLSYCKLDEIDFTVFKDLPSIELVNVSNNAIQSSTSRKFLKNIKCLDMSHNSLMKYDNIPSFCLDFSYTNMSGYRWFNVSEKNTTVFVHKFYYIGNKNLSINATNVHNNLLDIEIRHMNISEYKGNISDMELSKVKVTEDLILRGSNIPLLHKAIYNFKELFYEENPGTTLDLSNNSIAEISELYFEKYDLGVLNLCYNKLETLKTHVFYQARFGELLLCHSSIENIDKGTFDETIVKKMNLSHNKLSEIVFLSNINDVEVLDLSYNLIKFININTFTSLNSLEVVDLSNNLISALDAGIFTTNKLVEINLRNNNLEIIRTLSFNNLPNLSQLLLEGNNIKVIETQAFKSLPQIALINLANVGLENLQPSSFSDMVNLKVLYLNDNNISVLPTQLFCGVPSFKHIYLYNNNVDTFTTLSGLDLETLEINIGNGFTAGNLNIPKLKVLYITNSNIEVLGSGYLSGLYNLKELRLKNSVISSYEPSALKGLFQLQYLDPQMFNKVTVLKKYSFKDLRLLKQLDLSGFHINAIEPEAFYGLVTLEKLCLNNNNLVILSDGIFVGLSNVRVLDLKGNNISELHVKTFAGLAGIRELLLNENNIFSVPLGSFQVLGTLEVLNLARNRIARINVGTFSDLKNLRHLDLSFNGIESLCQAVLFPLNNLERLYLAGNFLHSVNELIAVGNLPKLNAVDINRNSFSCDDLVLIIRNFDGRNITLNSQNNQNFTTDNINGIVCTNSCLQS